MWTFYDVLIYFLWIARKNARESTALPSWIENFVFVNWQLCCRYCIIPPTQAFGLQFTASADLCRQAIHSKNTSVWLTSGGCFFIITSVGNSVPCPLNLKPLLFYQYQRPPSLCKVDMLPKGNSICPLKRTRYICHSKFDMFRHRRNEKIKISSKNSPRITDKKQPNQRLTTVG